NRTIREGRIRFSLDLTLAVKECDILMLCLPTPPGKDGQADLEMVMSASRHVAELLNELDVSQPRIVVNKSTVPVGTAALVQGIFDSVAPTRRVDVVSNPEFLREGFAVEDFMRPDRIVVGTSSPLAAEWMQSLYRPFTDRGATLLVFDEKSSEVTKYAANSFLATKISFMNDLSEYCEAVGADIENIRVGIGIDPRIGSRFLYAGIGYGGSCFPKDVKAIIHAADQAGTPLEVIKAAKIVNDHQVRRFTGRVVARFDGDLSGKRVALWGLAFKPDTDDVREAPSFVIIDRLLSEGAQVVAFDPEARETTHKVIGDRITYAEDAYSALSGADVLIVATEWQEFRDPDFARIRKELSAPIIFDGRNMFHPDDMQERGFEYHSVGRASVTP
ncbi:MAG: UDP-glucose dehydrogenase family protein, partial [Candidatus Kapaibacterium sp.]